MTKVECPECDGQGHYSVQREGRAGPGLGYEDVEAECSECNGTGKIEAPDGETSSHPGDYPGQEQ